MNRKLLEAAQMLKVMRSLIDMDLYVSVFDKNGVVTYIDPENGGSDGIRLGEYFDDPTGRLMEAIRTGKRIHNHIPSGKYGFEMEGNLVPVFDGDEVVGCIAATYLPANEKFMEAQQIAIQSIYSLILAVNAKTDKCIEVYRSYTVGLSDISIALFSSFAKESSRLIHPDDRERYIGHLRLDTLPERLRDCNSESCECRLLTPDGNYRWMEFVMCRVGDQNDINGESSFIYMARDIDRRKSTEERFNEENQQLIVQLARANDSLFQSNIRDQLTGIYNRKGLDHYADGVFKSLPENGHWLFLCMVDMDGLKYINDHFGHEGGDCAILALSQAISGVVPEDAICARTGGDEFVILAGLPPQVTDPQAIVNRLSERLVSFNNDSGLPFRVQASAGYYFGEPDEGDTLDVYMNKADARMYKIKEQKHTPTEDTIAVETRIQDLSKFRVLIADRDIDRSCFDGKYSLVEADNEKTLREIWSADEPLDLVILDISAPEFNGMGVLRRMRREKRLLRQPVLLTGSEHDIKYNAGEFITETAGKFLKPVPMAQFMLRVEYFVRRNAERKQMMLLLHEKDAHIALLTRQLDEKTK